MKLATIKKINQIGPSPYFDLLLISRMSDLSLVFRFGDTYTAFHQVSDLISKWFTVHTTDLTDVLPTWIEQSKYTYSWSTSSFPIIIYSGTIISFLSLSFIFFFPLPIYMHMHLHLYGACWLSVCD